MSDWERYLRASAVPRELVDQFLHEPGSWAKFDAELGYTLQNNLTPVGIDGSGALETFQANGARSGFLYAGRAPRIHAYGDSFTECSQVSDGETWEEYLGAHLGEPIANFGVGGYGVYQAYRRMLRVETAGPGAEYLILYVWGDDPTRSLMRARWPNVYPMFAPVVRAFRLFHANFWCHLELDLASGRFAERPNRLPTPESLYDMCDPDWMVANVHDDLAVHLAVYARGAIDALERKPVEALAGALCAPFDADAPDARRQAARLLNVYGQRATCFVLDQARAFATPRGKKLLVVLNATARAGDAVHDGARNDQEIVDHLVARGFDWFDMNAVHAREHAETRLSYAEYMSRYLVGAGGHYNPRGNHLFAFALKDTLVRLLEPKPLPYRELPPGTPVDFRGYLPGYH